LAKTRSVEPLGVVYYWFHDAWYLVARCPKADGLRHFRVDRIDGVMLTAARFEYPEDFDLSEYVSKMWGIYSGEPTQVRVRFFDEMNVVDRLHAEVSGRLSARLYQVDEGTMGARRRSGGGFRVQNMAAHIWKPLQLFSNRKSLETNLLQVLSE